MLNSANFQIVKVATLTDVPSGYPSHVCYYTEDTDKYYIWRNNVKEEVFVDYSSVVGTNVINVDYSNLISLRNNNNLIPGAYYRITDYQTIYEEPDYIDELTPVYTQDINIVSGPIEPLIVMALTVNTLHCDAYQEEYPQDKLKYVLDYTTHRTGATTKGRIYERIDNKNNRTDFDHRNVYFKRYLDMQNDLYANGIGIMTHYPKYPGAPSVYYKIFFPSASNNFVYGVWETLKVQNKNLQNYSGIVDSNLVKTFEGIKFDLPNVVLGTSDELACENNKFLDTTYNVTVKSTKLKNNTVTGKTLNLITDASNFEENNFNEIIDCIFLSGRKILVNNINYCYQSWVNGDITHNNIEVFHTEYYNDTPYPKVLFFNIVENNIKKLQGLNFCIPNYAFFKDFYSETYNYIENNSGTLSSGQQANIFIYDEYGNELLGEAIATINSNNKLVSLTIEEPYGESLKCSHTIMNYSSFKIKTSSTNELGSLPSTSNGYLNFGPRVFILRNESNSPWKWSIRRNNLILFTNNSINEFIGNIGINISYNIGFEFSVNNIKYFNNNYFYAVEYNNGVQIEECTFLNAINNDFGPRTEYCTFGNNFGGFYPSQDASPVDLLLVDNNQYPIDENYVSHKKTGNIFYNIVSAIAFGNNIVGNIFNISLYNDLNSTTTAITIPSNFKYNTVNAFFATHPAWINNNYFFDYPQLRESFPVLVTTKPKPITQNYQLGDYVEFAGTSSGSSFAGGYIFKKETTFSNLYKYTAILTNYGSSVINDNFILEPSKLLKNYNSTIGLINTEKLVLDTALWKITSAKIINFIRSINESLGVQSFILSIEEAVSLHSAIGSMYPLMNETRTFVTSSEADQTHMWGFNFTTGLPELVDKLTPLPVLIGLEYTTFNSLVLQYTDNYGAEITVDITR
jgi:hypothetical protein